MKIAFGPRNAGIDLSGNSRVLCVDDKVFNIEFLRCQLELIPTLQGRCDYVDNGISAVELVQHSLKKFQAGSKSFCHYSLILLDYSMPIMDGPTTAAKILALYNEDEVFSPTLTPPRPHIVCLTAFTEKIFENNARESGMKEFVSKPITNYKLKQILRERRLISLAEAIENN